MKLMSRISACLLAGGFCAPAVLAFDTVGHPSYNPVTPVIQGNQPIIPGAPTVSGTNPFSVTITAPSASVMGGSYYPAGGLTIDLGVSIPANVGAFPGVPIGGDAAVAVSWCTVSPASVTFSGPGAKVQVTVSLSVPAPVVSGSYYWNVKGTNWPSTSVVDLGCTINANVLPPITNPTVKPVIVNLLPVTGTSFTYLAPTPVQVAISFGATSVSTAAGGATIETLLGSIDTVPPTSLGLTAAGLNSTNPDGTFSASGSGTAAVTDSGPHTITVSATNAAGTTTATTQINILAPPRITNASNPTFTYGQSGSFSVTTTGWPAPTFTAAGLPSWASLDATTGVISGTPDGAGSSTISITATNAFNSAIVGTDSHDFTLTVNPAPLRVTASNASKTFGENDPALNYTITGGALIGSDTLGGALVRASGENAGVYAIGQGTLTASSNYNLTFIGANFSIVAKPITITPAALSKTYGASDPTLTYTYNPSLLDGGQFGGALARVAGEAVGSYAVAKGTLTAGANYSLSVAPVNFTITTAPLTITANSATKVYGAANPAFSVSYSGLVNHDSAISGVTFTAPPTTSAVGTYTDRIVPGGGTSTNYEITYVAGTLTITPASLTIKADNKNMVVGSELPTFTASVSGLVNGDAATIVAPLDFSTTATSDSPEGTYSIVVSGPTATANYSVAYVEGVLTVSTKSEPPECAPAIIRHAPKLNGNAGIAGSIQVLTAEDIKLNGNVWISDSLLVPGQPTIVLKGHPTYGTTIDGDGAPTPSNYTVTLDGNVTLAHVVQRTDAVAIPAIPLPPSSTGTRDVKLNKLGDSLGTFTTIRDLDVNGNAAPVSVPAGNYRDFTVSGNGGLILGVANATEPSVYSFRNLKFSGTSTLTVVGPVVLTLTGNATFNGNVGVSEHPEWMVLNLCTGDLKIDGKDAFYGKVNAPDGTVTINGLGKLCGSLTCDKLTIDGDGLLELCDCDSSAPSSGHGRKD